MKLTRFLSLLVVSIASFVTLGVAQAETRTVLFSPINYIFDSGYVIDEALQLFPSSEVLNYDSENYPGAILAGSKRAVLTTFSDVPEAQHRAILDEVFCSVTSSIVVAYSESDAYELLLVHIAVSDDVLSFTTDAHQLIFESRECD